MFHYNPNRELYLGLRKIAERMSANEVGMKAEELRSSGEACSVVPKFMRFSGNLERHIKTEIDGTSSVNVRDHAPRIIKKLGRGSVDLRDMCEPLVGRIASYSGFGMMGRRCREGDQYKKDAQDIQIWYSCHPDPESDGYFRLLFLHGSRKGNFVHNRSDSIPIIRSGSDTHEVFDFIRSCSDSPSSTSIALPTSPLVVDRFLWILAPKGEEAGEIASESDQNLNFDSLFYIESVISDSRGRDFLVPCPLFQSPNGELPLLSKIVVATPYVVQSSRGTWKMRCREGLNMMRRIMRLR